MVRVPLWVDVATVAHTGSKQFDTALHEAFGAAVPKAETPESVSLGFGGL